MDTIRIAILNTYDKVCAYLDNTVAGSMHYYDDELHQYLKGSANTYTFKANARHEDAIYLAEGNKLAFRYRGNDYYLNIMKVVRNEYEIEVTAYSLNFELLNEQKEAYKSSGAMTFAQYLDVFDYEKVVVLGKNEVSGKSISHEWTGTETMLGRIFSLANVFGAEVEFMPELNEDYSLKKIVMNVYREHTDTVQGVGTDRTDMILRYGKNVSGITKTSDITDLYTAIRPIGRNGLTVSSLNKTEYDSSGKVEYTCPAGKRNIYAVQARDRFPSNLLANENERYIAQIWEYDTDNVNVLYGQALAELKKNCVPQVSYEVDGYFDTGIGDTITIADDEYTPELYLQARVTEQSRSFTDPTQNKTTFSNFKELQSEIDPVLLQKMNNLINANKVYTCSILTDNGIIFQNGEGSTTLTASVMDVGKDMTNTLTIQWTVDGEKLSTGKSIKVNAADIPGKAVYRYEATDKSGISRGYCEVTVANVNDGEPGRPGEDGGHGADAYTLYLSTASHVFNADYDGNIAKNISVSTVAVGFRGTKQLTPVIGTIQPVDGMGISISGSTIVFTALKGKDLADNGAVNIPVIIDGIECTLTFTYAKVKDGYHGEDAKLCTITGDQVMKYVSGSSIPDPKTIILTAEYQNTNHGKWQYLDQYNVWVDFIPEETNSQITISEDSAAWKKDTALIRALDVTQVAIDTITLAKLRDGTDAIIVHISSVNGFTFKNTGVSTIMTASVIVGETIIDTSAKLREKFGSNAKLIWSYKNVGETKFTPIDRSDPRFSDDGFIFTLSPQDVYNKITLDCGLDY
jgi:phage minor structural protein|nr:MAG TPA: tail protein [Caudoviricetes sp.]